MQGLIPKHACDSKILERIQSQSAAMMAKQTDALKG